VILAWLAAGYSAALGRVGDALEGSRSVPLMVDAFNAGDILIEGDRFHVDARTRRSSSSRSLRNSTGNRARVFALK
jgi:hypothetical protein